MIVNSSGAALSEAFRHSSSNAARSVLSTPPLSINHHALVVVHVEWKTSDFALTNDDDHTTPTWIVSMEEIQAKKTETTTHTAHDKQQALILHQDGATATPPQERVLSLDSFSLPASSRHHRSASCTFVVPLLKGQTQRQDKETSSSTRTEEEDSLEDATDVSPPLSESRTLLISLWELVDDDDDDDSTITTGDDDDNSSSSTTRRSLQNRRLAVIPRYSYHNKQSQSSSSLPPPIATVTLPVSVSRIVSNDNKSKKASSMGTVVGSTMVRVLGRLLGTVLVLFMMVFLFGLVIMHRRPSPPWMVDNGDNDVAQQQTKLSGATEKSHNHDASSIQSHQDDEEETSSCSSRHSSAGSQSSSNPNDSFCDDDDDDDDDDGESLEQIDDASSTSSSRSSHQKSEEEEDVPVVVVAEENNQPLANGDTGTTPTTGDVSARSGVDHAVAHPPVGINGNNDDSVVVAASFVNGDDILCSQGQHLPKPQEEPPQGGEDEEPSHVLLAANDTTQNMRDVPTRSDDKIRTDSRADISIDKDLASQKRQSEEQQPKELPQVLLDVDATQHPDNPQGDVEEDSGPRHNDSAVKSSINKGIMPLTKLRLPPSHNMSTVDTTESPGIDADEKNSADNHCKTISAAGKSIDKGTTSSPQGEEGPPQISRDDDKSHPTVPESDPEKGDSTGDNDDATAATTAASSPNQDTMFSQRGDKEPRLLDGSDATCPYEDSEGVTKDLSLGGEQSQLDKIKLATATTTHSPTQETSSAKGTIGVDKQESGAEDWSFSHRPATVQTASSASFTSGIDHASIDPVVLSPPPPKRHSAEATFMKSYQPPCHAMRRRSSVARHSLTPPGTPPHLAQRRPTAGRPSYPATPPTDTPAGSPSYPTDAMGRRSSMATSTYPLTPHLSPPRPTADRPSYSAIDTPTDTPPAYTETPPTPAGSPSHTETPPTPAGSPSHPTQPQEVSDGDKEASGLRARLMLPNLLTPIPTQTTYFTKKGAGCGDQENPLFNDGNNNSMSRRPTMGVDHTSYAGATREVSLQNSKPSSSPSSSERDATTIKRHLDTTSVAIATTPFPPCSLQHLADREKSTHAQKDERNGSLCSENLGREPLSFRQEDDTDEGAVVDGAALQQPSWRGNEILTQYSREEEYNIGSQLPIDETPDIEQNRRSRATASGRSSMLPEKRSSSKRVVMEVNGVNAEVEAPNGNGDSLLLKNKNLDRQLNSSQATLAAAANTPPPSNITLRQKPDFSLQQGTAEGLIGPQRKRLLFFPRGASRKKPILQDESQAACASYVSTLPPDSDCHSESFSTCGNNFPAEFENDVDGLCEETTHIPGQQDTSGHAPSTDVEAVSKLVMQDPFANPTPLPTDLDKNRSVAFEDTPHRQNSTIALEEDVVTPVNVHDPSETQQDDADDLDDPDATDSVDRRKLSRSSPEPQNREVKGIDFASSGDSDSFRQMLEHAPSSTPDSITASRPKKRKRQRPYVGSKILPDWVPSNKLRSVSQTFEDSTHWSLQDVASAKESVPKSIEVLKSSRRRGKK